MLVEYEVNGGGLYLIEVKDVTDNDCIADLCADDYYRNHGGWASSCPLEIEIAFQVGEDLERC